MTAQTRDNDETASSAHQPSGNSTEQAHRQSWTGNRATAQGISHQGAVDVENKSDSERQSDRQGGNQTWIRTKATGDALAFDGNIGKDAPNHSKQTWMDCSAEGNSVMVNGDMSHEAFKELMKGK